MSPEKCRGGNHPGAGRHRPSLRHVGGYPQGPWCGPIPGGKVLLLFSRLYASLRFRTCQVPIGQVQAGSFGCQQFTGPNRSCAHKVQKDPVCGMTVDASKASASIEHEGTLYHFCSKGCGEKFKADPEKFLSPKYKPAGMGATSQTGETQLLPPGKFERDPVCGMNVDPAKAAVTLAHGGSTYYFCCRGCADKFKADPEKYLGSRPNAVAGATAAGRDAGNRPVADATYVCPMDPEVRQSGPGACPKCGMALEPDTPRRCPRKHYGPARCIPRWFGIGRVHVPICGMALEPRVSQRKGRGQFRATHMTGVSLGDAGRTPGIPSRCCHGRSDRGRLLHLPPGWSRGSHVSWPHRLSLQGRQAVL